MNILWARAAERIVALLVGALCIYLGYRLFVSIPTLAQQSDGEFDMFGIEVTLTQVGPGVFFALFGAVVLWLSIRTQYEIDWSPGRLHVEAASPQETDGAVMSVRYMGGGVQFEDQQAADSARALLLRDMRAIDRLAGELGSNSDEAISNQARADFLIAVPRVKEAMMLTVWDGDWGDAAAFRRWVEKGAGDPAPAGLEAAARFFGGDGP